MKTKSITGTSLLAHILVVYLDVSAAIECPPRVGLMMWLFKISPSVIFGYAACNRLVEYERMRFAWASGIGRGEYTYPCSEEEDEPVEEEEEEKEFDGFGAYNFGPATMNSFTVEAAN